MAAEKKMSFYMTCGISDDMDRDAEFGFEVADAIHKFTVNDWGCLCRDDCDVNKEALKHGGRVMGAYHTKLGKIWIINDDALAEEMTITVLYPNEY